MPDFLVTGPDGKKYRVTGATAEGAKAAVKKQMDATTQPFSGRLLPISRQEAGGPVSFDSNAGIIGSAKRAFTLPHDVMTGDVDLNTQEGIGRVFEMGSWTTPMNPAVRAGDKILPGMSQSPSRKGVAIPTADELTTVGGKQIGSAEKMGVDFKGEAVANWAQSLRANLEREIHPSRAKESYELLHSLETAPTGSVMEFRGLVAARQNFQDIAQNAVGKDKAAATQIIKGIDEFLARPPAESVLAGPAAVAASKYERGRANYAAGKRSNAINAREDSAELQAVVANSGKNSGNRIRAAAKWFVDPLHPERLSGFSKDEAALINAVATGNKGRNTLRFVGNLLGGGGGLGGFLTGTISGGLAGGAGGRPGLGAAIGATAPAVGATARALDNRLTSNAMRRADKAVRMRNPMYSARQQRAPMTAISPAARAAIQGAGAKAVTVPTLVPQRPTMTEEEYRIFLLQGGA